MTDATGFDSAAGQAEWRLDGRDVPVNRLDEALWPENGVTKDDLLAYYRDMAPTMLPYFADRPATLFICRGGIDGHCFYRRDLPDDAPSWLRRVGYRPASRATGPETQLPLVDDAAGLVWLANAGAIEFHLWTAHAPALTQPDQVVFDLDPGEGATFPQALEAAALLHETLTDLGLRGCAKTSGGRGMHVILPLAPGPSYVAVRAWAKGVAARMAAARPDLIATQGGATHRGSRVTVDYAQNSIGRNTAAPYTVRARPGAPVSTPVTWDEVRAGRIDPAAFNLRSVPARVATVGDLFRAALGPGQALPPL
ncbi:MAG TPA: non-homologous end-joining DNA ligase [Thermomicrobiales bacterium]|nr:non-homologous end-joining DNA ligase [Thermomicrobiales bacterium]